jgi:predicted nucleic acid-binding protein
MLLLDSDVLIDVLRQYNPAVGWLAASVGQPLSVPGYVAMETIRGCANRIEVRRVEGLLESFNIIWPSSAGCSRALELMKQFQLSHKIGVIDSLIAQTAIDAGLPLHTFNIKHYSIVPDLKIIQPYARN